MDLEYYSSYLEVDLGILRSNAEKIMSAIKPRKFIPVVKGNSHGNGTVPVAAMLIEDLGINLIANAQIIESKKIRDAGYKDTELMLLSAVPYHALPYVVEYNLIAPVFDKKTAKLLSDAVSLSGKKYQDIQIKIETGLHRLGVNPQKDLNGLIAYIRSLKNLRIVGVYSHFGNAYEFNDEFTINQYKLFEDAVWQVRGLGIDPKYVHICCSGGSMWVEDTISTHARLGCMFTGFSGLDDGRNPFDVETAASWRAFITNICHLKPGERAGYGYSCVADREMTTATVSVGICDGFFRPLASSKAPLLVNGKRAKYLSVCMDQMFIDVTGIDCEIGDEVTIFGKDRLGNNITTEYISKFVDHSPTSLTGYLNDRVKRIYINR